MRAYHKAFEARDRREHWRFAQLCSVVANCHRDPKAKPDPFTPDDFLPRERPQSQQDLITRVRAFCGAMRTAT